MYSLSNGEGIHTIKNPTSQSNQDLRPRPRKPSPGLAARLEALRLGIESNKPDPRNDYPNQIGRISEEQIKKLDSAHQASSHTLITRRSSTRRGSTKLEKTESSDGIVTEATEINLTMPEQDSTMTSPTLATFANTEKAEMIGHDDNLLKDAESHEAKQNLNMKDYNFEMCESAVGHPSPDPNDPVSNSDRPGNMSPETQPSHSPPSLQRTGSVHTISRVSFTSQLAQLTSLQLPDAESLSTMINQFPTAKSASTALARAAEQIRSWIFKASEVIAGLAGDDDVDWAAAGGREGLEEVDKSITRFEGPINVYVTTIELLQNRTDIRSFSPDELKKITAEMDIVLEEWTKIKNNLKEVKKSVEIAMEWQELWNTVLGDIGAEMDMLRKLVFEMEEIRHQSVTRVSDDSMGLEEIGSIIEERTHQSRNMHSISNDYNISPMIQNVSSQPFVALDDTYLLSLFARMQPLRASLDFFPMRLSAFLIRAKETFPTACRELETRLMELEANWKNLEIDAESLRKELGEDRWVLVFRVAGQQAHRIYESIERSFVQLLEATESTDCLENLEPIVNRYMKKKNHYGPAIESVLSIIDKGVDERLTVNGEILRLHWEMRRKWDGLKDRMNELEKTLIDNSANKKIQQHKDSIITSVLIDNSSHTNLCITPGSSPMSTNFLPGLPCNPSIVTSGPSQVNKKSKLPQLERRISSLPVEISRPTRQSLLSTLSNSENSPISNSNKRLSVTPTGNRLSKTSVASSSEGKPRWNSSTKIQEGSIGHNFKPYFYSTPSPHSSSKPPANNSIRASTEPRAYIHSPLIRRSEASTATYASYSNPSNSRISFRERLTERLNTTSRCLQNVARPTASQPRIRSRLSLSDLDFSYKDHIQSRKGNNENSTKSKTKRPVTSIRNSRRASYLPVPKPKQPTS